MLSLFFLIYGPWVILPSLGFWRSQDSEAKNVKRTCPEVVSIGIPCGTNNGKISWYVRMRPQFVGFPSRWIGTGQNE